LSFGLTDAFRKIAPVCVSVLSGFYAGSIPGILIFRDPRAHNLLALTRTPEVLLPLARRGPRKNAGSA
jgi:hypothetical protein